MTAPWHVPPLRFAAGCVVVAAALLFALLAAGDSPRARLGCGIVSVMAFAAVVALLLRRVA